MPTQWYTPSLDGPDVGPSLLSPGLFIEYQIYDDHYNVQGTLLGHSTSVKTITSSGQGLTVRTLGSTDEFLQWWLESGSGRTILDIAGVHFCKGSPSTCPSKPGVALHYHTVRLRVVEVCDIDNERYGWLKNSTFFGGRALQFLAAYTPPSGGVQEQMRKSALRVSAQGDSSGALERES